MNSFVTIARQVSSLAILRQGEKKLGLRDGISGND